MAPVFENAHISLRVVERRLIAGQSQAASAAKLPIYWRVVNSHKVGKKTIFFSKGKWADIATETSCNNFKRSSLFPFEVCLLLVDIYLFVSCLLLPMMLFSFENVTEFSSHTAPKFLAENSDCFFPASVAFSYPGESYFRGNNVINFLNNISVKKCREYVTTHVEIYFT